MSTPEKINIPSQITVRFNDDERAFINENLHLLTASFEKPESEISRNELMVKAFLEAIGKSKPVIKDNPEHLAKIAEQQKAIDDLQELFENVQLTVEELQKNEAPQLPPGAIVLNLPINVRQYFWGVLQLSIKNEFATTYEDLLEKMFKVYHARNEFLFTPEDLEYLKSLDYDGPAEN